MPPNKREMPSKAAGLEEMQGFRSGRVGVCEKPSWQGHGKHRIPTSTKFEQSGFCVNFEKKKMLGSLCLSFPPFFCQLMTGPHRATFHCPRA